MKAILTRPSLLILANLKKEHLRCQSYYWNGGSLSTHCSCLSHRWLPLPHLPLLHPPLLHLSVSCGTASGSLVWAEFATWGTGRRRYWTGRTGTHPWSGGRCKLHHAHTHTHMCVEEEKKWRKRKIRKKWWKKGNGRKRKKMEKEEEKKWRKKRKNGWRGKKWLSKTLHACNGLHVIYCHYE